MDYSKKYLLYKKKYIELKQSQNGGNIIYEKTYVDTLHDNDITRKLYIQEYTKSEIIDTNNKNINNVLNTNNNIDVLIRNINDPSITIKNQVLFVFDGWGGRFSNLYNITKNYNGMIIFFSDKYNEWYSGLLGAFLEVIKEFALNIDNYIFLGLSMGGYAALHASVYFPFKRSICIAIGPQTVDFNKYKKLAFKEDVLYNEGKKVGEQPIIIPTVDIYKSIPQVFNEHEGYNTKIYNLLGKSECNDYTSYNTPMHFDAMHIGAIMEYPNVKAVIFNAATHRLLEKFNLKNILSIIENKFDILFFNQNEGLQILVNEISYFTK